MTDTLLDPAAVKDYYGEILQGSTDLKTNACTCDLNALTPTLRQGLSLIHPEILNRFYGCGSPLPPLLEGQTILDLGCGTGRDVFLAAWLAGPQGSVIGVDMTVNQLAVARKHADNQAKQFGFPHSTTTFHLGQMEDLSALGIEDNSIDVVMSNCVINLSPRKAEIFREIFRVLTPGGELIFSDVFADRRVPNDLQSDPVLHGECLSGAMYTEDFRRLLTSLNCPDFRIVSSAPLVIGDPEIEARTGLIRFTSQTIRAFKLPDLEDTCEDYGHVAIYQGGIPDAPHSFALDEHHTFPTGKAIPICGNTASILTNTRYAPHFQVQGNRNRHFGLFPCTPPNPASPDPAAGTCC